MEAQDLREARSRVPSPSSERRVGIQQWTVSPMHTFPSNAALLGQQLQIRWDKEMRYPSCSLPKSEQCGKHSKYWIATATAL